MNTDAIAKHYGLLSARERVTLILAASGRGDELESERLANSAPMITLECPHHFGFGQAIQEASFMYLTEQLHFVGGFYRVQRLLDALLVRGDRKKRGRKQNEVEQTAFFNSMFLVGWIAYLIVVSADGWRQFCAEMNFETDAMLACLPGRSLLTDALEDARRAAFTIQDADAYTCRWLGENGRAPTIEDVVASWREFIEARTKWWGVA